MRCSPRAMPAVSRSFASTVRCCMAYAARSLALRQSGTRCVPHETRWHLPRLLWRRVASPWQWRRFCLRRTAARMVARAPTPLPTAHPPRTRRRFGCASSSSKPSSTTTRPTRSSRCSNSSALRSKGVQMGYRPPERPPSAPGCRSPARATSCHHLPWKGGSTPPALAHAMVLRPTPPPGRRSCRPLHWRGSRAQRRRRQIPRRRSHPSPRLSEWHAPARHPPAPPPRAPQRRATARRATARLLGSRCSTSPRRHSLSSASPTGIHPRRATATTSSAS
mmetsp:Transcript_12433/g.31751  ORF Transcript_12433/g.31751 Transcript_12433/m.31751 type:complete len:278 (+) Transcript_12433:1041-1874(+)